MALLPLVAVRCSQVSKISQANNNSTVEQNNSDSNKILCGLVAARCNQEYCDETIKAIAILINTDYKADKDSFELDDKEIYLSDENFDNSEKELYSKIENIVSSNKELYLTYSDEIKYIPYSESSNGITKKSEKYEYLSSVASPWDCFDKSFDENTECSGVSIYGVDYLCKNGMSAKDALKWYLPNFEIKSK